MTRKFSFIIVILILILSCTKNENTVLDEKVFSLKLNHKWEKRYYKDSILLERINEQLLFQTYSYQNELSETEITNTLLKLIEAYRKAETQKSRETQIGENHYGQSDDIYFIRFIGSENDTRFFTVFIFGTAHYGLSVYFEKINTNGKEFEKSAGEILNKIVLKK
ncbi:MAG: hypothetical protein JXJ04_21720 [Spirochaetales bacterium]|nr:hypothetical protein [Spirochaetales bacterium]